MTINIGPPSVEELRPRITVIGVGGAGGNAIANMIDAGIEGVDFIVANTDAQALNSAVAEHRIQLGPEITQGLGAGSRPEVGRAAAEETVEEIERALDGVNMVFIAAGMGGGTGTGAAPVIAEVARSKGILTVGVVTKPFLFEGTRRTRSAEAGIEELQKNVDTLLVIPNQNLFLVAKAETTFKEAFQLADEVLQMGVRSITDLMVMPGLINLDFADIRSVMNEMGKAMMGTGEGEGSNRALEAAERAIANPLLDGVSMQGAKGVIISIIGGEDMKLLEVDEAANHIRELVDPDANIIWGSAFNPELEGRIRVSVVATGIEATGERPQSSTQPFNLSAARGPRKPVVPAKDEVAAQGKDAQPPRADSAGAGKGQTSDAASLRESERTSEPGALPDPADDSELAEPGRTGGFAGNETGEGDEQADGGEIFELTQEVGPSATDDETEAEREDNAASRNTEQDELLLEEKRPAQRKEPTRAFDGGARRPRILSGGAANEDSTRNEQPAGGRREATRPAPASGSTLFERMANLSRKAPEPQADAEEEKDNNSSAVRIPRFLGRQNNQ